MTGRSQAGRWPRSCASALSLLLLAGALAACSRGGPAAPAAPGTTEIRAALSTNVIHVGDVVRLRAEVTHPEGAQVAWPAVGSDRAIVLRQVLAAPRSGSPHRSERTWEITSLEVGTHAVWSGSVTSLLANGESLELPLPPLALRVESLLTEADARPRDIKGLAAWPRRGLQTVAWALLAVAVLALAAGLLVVLLRRRARLAPAAPPVPPHERALGALRDLQGRGWIEQEAVEPFYVELSAIVRRYLEDRFGVRAPEQTTEEFIRAATTSRLLSPEHQQLVIEFLAQCDLVKFARHHPQQADMRSALAAAERLVRETVPTLAATEDGTPITDH